jgi:hypothetical protein
VGFDPESRSAGKSLTSNSRAFSIKKLTFSREIASSGMARSLAPGVPTNALAREMIHCAG